MAVILVTTIRSFIIYLYDRAFKIRGEFSLSLTVLSPFANRLLREALPHRQPTLREPWYAVQPYLDPQVEHTRTTYPVGLTSLYSKRYVPEEEPLPRVTLAPDAPVRFFAFSLHDLQEELYAGDYSTDDLFRAGAEYLARQWIARGNMAAGDGPFYYAVVPSNQEVRTMKPGLFPPDALQIEGVFPLPLLAFERERIPFRRVPAPPLPVCTPAAYPATRTLGRGATLPNRILLHAAVYQALAATHPLSDKAEEGGYLLGLPYRLPDSPEDEDAADFHWLIEITQLLPAQGTRGSAALLVFTGESWSQVNRQRDLDFPATKLVAWFHTHLFAATDTFGLSGLDQELHRRFLTKPWQIAVLVNLDRHGQREVRCFQRGPEGDLIECRFEVLDPVSADEPPKEAIGD